MFIWPLESRFVKKWLISPVLTSPAAFRIKTFLLKIIISYMGKYICKFRFVEKSLLAIWAKIFVGFNLSGRLKVVLYGLFGHRNLKIFQKMAKNACADQPSGH